MADTITSNIPQHKFETCDIAFKDHQPYAMIYGIIEAETLGGNTEWLYIMQLIWPDKEECVYEDGWVAGACFQVEQFAMFDNLYQSLSEEEEHLRKLAADAEAAIHAAAAQAKMMDGARNA